MARRGALVKQLRNRQPSRLQRRRRRRKSQPRRRNNLVVDVVKVVVVVDVIFAVSQLHLLRHLQILQPNMIKDLPDNTVKDIAIAVALEKESAESKIWYVYLINLKNEP